VTPALVDGDCRVRQGEREVWMLFVDDDARAPRLEPGWVSPSYGVKLPTQTLVIDGVGLPASLQCVFAERPLSMAERRSAIAALDARGRR
jgi:hypothetical protein